MELKFLQSLIIEDHEERMSVDELKKYLRLLYKKCNKKTQKNFNKYLSDKCGVEDADLSKCSDKLCADEKMCDEVIHHLEELSEKLDENSLQYILESTTTDDYSEVEKHIVDEIKRDWHKPYGQPLRHAYGLMFFEHPQLGDESSIIVKTEDGRFYYTGWYDWPSDFEFKDLANALDRY